MKAQSQPRHVAAAVSHPSKTTPGVSNGIQHFALIFKALSRFVLLLGHTGSMLFWTLLWIVILAISFCLEVLYLFIRSGIHSSSSLGSLLVSLRCHALRELLLTPHLKFSPFSVTICHDHYSCHPGICLTSHPGLHMKMCQTALGLYSIIFFSSQHISLSKDHFIFPFFSCKLSLPIRGLVCFCHFYIPLTRRMVLKRCLLKK